MTGTCLCLVLSADQVLAASAAHAGALREMEFGEGVPHEAEDARISMQCAIPSRDAEDQLMMSHALEEVLLPVNMTGGTQKRGVGICSGPVFSSVPTFAGAPPSSACMPTLLRCGTLQHVGCTPSRALW